MDMQTTGLSFENKQDIFIVSTYISQELDQL